MTGSLLQYYLRAYLDIPRGLYMTCFKCLDRVYYSYVPSVRLGVEVINW